MTTPPVDPWEDETGFEKRHVRFVVGCLFWALGFTYAGVIIYRLAAHGEKPGFIDIAFMATPMIAGYLLASPAVGLEVLRMILEKLPGRGTVPS